MIHLLMQHVFPTLKAEEKILTLRKFAVMHKILIFLSLTGFLPFFLSCQNETKSDIKKWFFLNLWLFSFFDKLNVISAGHATESLLC